MFVVFSLCLFLHSFSTTLVYNERLQKMRCLSCLEVRALSDLINIHTSSTEEEISVVLDMTSLISIHIDLR